MVIDLVGLSFIDSSGFSALVEAKNRAAHEGRDLVLTRPQRNVEKVFEIIGLRDLIEPWSSVWI